MIKLIVDVLEGLVIWLAVLAVLGGAALGYFIVEGSYKYTIAPVFGGIIGLLLGGLAAAIFLGPAAVLIDIRNTLEKGKGNS